MTNLREQKIRERAFAESGIAMPIKVQAYHYNILHRAWIRFARFIDRLTGEV